MIVTSYAELEQYVKAAAENRIGLTLVTGLGGTGKTWTIKNALKASKKPHLVLSSHATPASTYENLFNHRDETIFLNDIDKIFSQPVLVSLLKQAAETNQIRELQYNSKTPLMADLPSRFETKSNLIIDANEVPKKNANMAALLTRGVHIEFCPKPQDVLAQLKTYAKDAEIVSLFEEVVSSCENFDLRKYAIAVQLKAAKLDWRTFLIRELGVSKEYLLANTLLTQAVSYADKVAEWTQKTGKSARSYDRTIKKIRGV